MNLSGYYMSCEKKNNLFKGYMNFHMTYKHLRESLY
jgi:hypothetical protein